MSFSESLKLLVKKQANFRCCRCQTIGVEIHHIIPVSEGGSDELENAAPLCPNCHSNFGDNPQKRKETRQMRDHWYQSVETAKKELMKGKSNQPFSLIKSEPSEKEQKNSQAVAIYHVVFAHENFEKAAKMLFELIKSAQQKEPEKRRALYLDIDGHKNSDGGYDHDMFELQLHFILGFLFNFLSEVHMPLIAVKNKNKQRNDFPDVLRLFESKKDAINAMHSDELESFECYFPKQS